MQPVFFLPIPARFPQNKPVKHKNLADTGKIFVKKKYTIIANIFNNLKTIHHDHFNFKWYLIGALVSTLIGFISEHFYLCAGKSYALSWKNRKDNFILTALSWIGVALALLYYVIEACHGFPSYGEDLFLYDYEQELIKRQNTDRINDENIFE